MALQHNIPATDNQVGIDLTNCYTVVTDVEVKREPRYSPPAEEGGAPILRTNHTVYFKTFSYISAAAVSEGKMFMARHSYEEDYPLTYSEDNVISYIYAWLKANVAVYSSATDV